HLGSAARHALERRLPLLETRHVGIRPVLEQPRESLEPRRASVVVALVPNEEIERRVAVRTLGGREVGAVRDERLETCAPVELRRVVDGFAILRLGAALE